MIRIRIANRGVVTPASLSIAASRPIARAIADDCDPDLTNPLEVVRQAWADVYGCAPIEVIPTVEINDLYGPTLSCRSR